MQQSKDRTWELKSQLKLIPPLPVQPCQWSMCDILWGGQSGSLLEARELLFLTLGQVSFISVVYLIVTCASYSFGASLRNVRVRKGNKERG